MVITFSHPTAFAQLKHTGSVVSFRADERERTPRDGIQETWCNRGRGQEKEFDVAVSHIHEKEAGSDQSPFQVYHHLSGFKWVEDWKKAVLEMHGKVPPTGHFYLVNRTDVNVLKSNTIGSDGL